MSRYFLDSEFIEDGSTIDIISIALVSEDGRSIYRQNLDCDLNRATDWVWRNVFPHLLHFDMSGSRMCKPVESEKLPVTIHGKKVVTVDRASKCEDSGCPWATQPEIAKAVLEFCDLQKYGKPEFWGYCADYDWVAFCQLFGRMVDVPKGFPMYCRDVKQWCDQLGNPRLPERGPGEHHALVDAEWVKEAWEFLQRKPA